MRLRVAHETAYRFDPPTRGVVQSHRLTPSEFEGQQVIDWQVDAGDVARGAGFRDGAGDWIETISAIGPVDSLTVRVTGEVETVDLGGVLRGHRERIRPAAYLRATRATKADRVLQELARDTAQTTGSEDALALAHALTHAVGRAITYTPGRTVHSTTAVEAIALGHGVCQDHAHALIAAALVLGLPARYVTGYLFASEEDGMQEASHAWAELYLHDLGWVGFDVSNGICPDARYIRIGSGSDATEAAPIRGVSQGLAAEHLTAHVRVDQVAQ